MNYAGSPSFCAIAPISYSHLVAGSQSHLVLAHLIDKQYQPESNWKKVDEYVNFIRQESDAGAYIMMDNGAYELHESYAPDRLLELARTVNADAIVLPDYPFKPAATTIAAAEELAPVFKGEGFHTFFVPQSKTGDCEDWISAYKWATTGAGKELVDIIGISILGVPNAWNNIDPAFARVAAMQSLIDRGIYCSDKHHHFLGLNAGPALEIPSLLRMGVLDTIDSSGPVWAGIQGHRYTTEADSYQSVKKLTSPVDFFLPFTKDVRTTDRIMYNVELTRDLFKPEVYQSSAPWYAVE